MSNGKVNFEKFLKMLAFVGVIAVAFALLFKTIFVQSVEVANAFSLVAQIIAYFVTAVYGFYYILSKRNAVITITYVISIIAIVVLLIV
ncbi:MAG: hypothetical protein PHQ62_02025 [Clostridia bacterium]|nr:hypothetical protein [Clostridia bacterium]